MIEDRRMRISINRLEHSWIAVLRDKKDPKADNDKIQKRETYKNLLQMNFESFAVLFNISKDTRPGASSTDVCAEELC